MRAVGNTVYELDAGNRIHRIQGEWAELCMGEVLGTRLESHIQDDTTRMLIKTVVAGVRQTKNKKSISYRCDSPELKRFMVMLIEPMMGDGVRLSHSFLRSEPLDPPVYIRPASGHAEMVNARCSICNRIEVERSWLEPDDACLTAGCGSFNVSYTVCPVCLNTV
ncbi:MAG: hypothetical protein ABW092_14555 [Candidatus Thiodiazotropha sp.]